MFAVLFQSCSLSVTSQNSDASPRLVTTWFSALSLRQSAGQLVYFQTQSTRLIAEVELHMSQSAVNRRQNNAVFRSAAERRFCKKKKKSTESWLESGWKMNIKIWGINGSFNVISLFQPNWLVMKAIMKMEGVKEGGGKNLTETDVQNRAWVIRETFLQNDQATFKMPKYS